MNTKNSPILASTFCASILAACVWITLSSSAVGATGLEKVIYKFNGGSDGQYPTGGLIADRAGNLYGITVDSYATTGCSSNCGTVFELSPPASAGGEWTKTTLHSFQGGSDDGSHPSETLVMDGAGNLYGATWNGGPGDNGAIFELIPPASSGGAWSETVLYTFPADGSGGTNPNGALVFDADHNLYGTTIRGGSPACDCGVIFELSPSKSGGGWAASLLHVFTATPNSGAYPSGGLIFDHSNALYGVTTADYLPDGEYDPAGSVFKLRRDHGKWAIKTIHDFGISYLAGGSLLEPETLTMDRDGNLWGNAIAGGWWYEGGSHCFPVSCGGVFEVSPPSVPGKPWNYSEIFWFWGPQYAKREGLEPLGKLLIDRAGNVYGTTFGGGLDGRNNPGNQGGTVFQLQPPTESGGTWSLDTLQAFAGSPNDGKSAAGNMVVVNGAFYGTTSGGGSAACEFGCGTVFRLVVTP